MEELRRVGFGGEQELAQSGRQGADQYALRKACVRGFALSGTACLCECNDVLLQQGIIHKASGRSRM